MKKHIEGMPQVFWTIYRNLDLIQGLGFEIQQSTCLEPIGLRMHNSAESPRAEPRMDYPLPPTCITFYDRDGLETEIRRMEKMNELKERLDAALAECRDNDASHRGLDYGAVEERVAAHEAAKAAKDCDCSKEKFGFMTHASWCPDNEHNLSKEATMTEKVDSPDYRTPGDIAATTLKPCPFCGSSDIDPRGWASKDDHGPGCMNCGATADKEWWNVRNGREHETYQ